jgi:hypothetical protein
MRARVCATVFMMLIASHLSRGSKRRLPEARVARQRIQSNLGEGRRRIYNLKFISRCQALGSYAARGDGLGRETAGIS